MIYQEPDVSVILPCQNEETALPEALQTIQRVFQRNNVRGEIIVSDSSTDASPDIAKAFNVCLHKHNKDGYGTAIIEGVQVARGKHLFIADPDGSYDFHEIPRFMQALETGHEFVIGNRFHGDIDKGAMPWVHQYIGKPLFSFFIKRFFRKTEYDVHCGMRALGRDTFHQLGLVSEGMEFASEMLIKGFRQELRITQLPINYSKRKGQSKLKTVRDGLRHCALLLRLFQQR